jgi:glycogen debranching enzyme
MLTILDGTTFAISDGLGDIAGGVHGFYDDDTRLLSRCRLTLDGAAPQLLSSQVVEYFRSAHYARNTPSESIPADSVSIARERFIEDHLVEHIVVRNESAGELLLRIRLELGSDFADILAVKAHDFALGDPTRAAPLPRLRGPAQADPCTLRLDDPESTWSTRVTLSRPATLVDSCCCFDVTLPPRESWALVVEVERGDDSTQATSPGTRSEHQRVQDSLHAWNLRVPRLDADWSELERCYERSISDLASLRIHSLAGPRDLPAAGMPWFMTLFGRDTIITSLQTMLFGPELAIGALRSLASLQATACDPTIDAEPGKILHELRRGKAATAWFPIYYGTADATPLFLVLLSEVWRWTGDDELVRELEPAARAALDWIDRYGDRDGDGLVEYERRTDRGLENQSWKDSGDSQRFRDGRYAQGPIAPVEVQGYVYDAKLRMAQLARAVLGDSALASKLEEETSALQRAFDERFWLEERNAYALALDGDKKPVDSLCSNNGHLLWSGIVPQRRHAALAATLRSAALWTGWGLRTMSSADAAYNPLGYHTGTVWPHDTALGAWGLALAGEVEHAWEMARSVIDAARFFDYSLPEVFAGYARTETAFPVAYPTAARPQAWASGAPVLCLQLLLGVRPDPIERRLVGDGARRPEWLGDATLRGVPAFEKHWDLMISGGALEVLAVE